jgi:hypothetical protein
MSKKVLDGKSKLLRKKSRMEKESRLTRFNISDDKMIQTTNKRHRKKTKLSSYEGNT